MPHKPKSDHLQSRLVPVYCATCAVGGGLTVMIPYTLSTSEGAALAARFPLGKELGLKLDFLITLLPMSCDTQGQQL